MRKNNLFNRIFHSKIVEKEWNDYKKYKLMLASYEEFYSKITGCKSLPQLLNLHKEIWALGYQNDNLGPCEYGMFRTKSIPKMTQEEVFLGNIYGLFTKNIPFWEFRKKESYGSNGFGIDPETSLYSLLLVQYRRILLSNLRSIKNQISEYVSEYEDLNCLKVSNEIWR